MSPSFLQAAIHTEKRQMKRRFLIVCDFGKICGAYSVQFSARLLFFWGSRAAVKNCPARLLFFVGYSIWKISPPRI